MHNFGFDILIIFLFALYTGQSGVNKKRLRYNKFYFLKSKLIHRQQCYYNFTATNITQKVVWNTKHNDNDNDNEF